MISKSGGMSGTIMIKDKKELKQLEDKLAQAKKLYNIKFSFLPVLQGFIGVTLC